MHTANSYQQICEILNDGFLNRYPHKSSIITGIVFSSPDLKFAQDEIIPHINRWFHACDSHTDFFCGGYLEGISHHYKDLREVKEIDGIMWYYSDELFGEFVNEIRSLSEWHPSGGADLILTNARYDKTNQKAYLDLSSAISIDLQKARDEKLFTSVSHLFQDVFDFAKDINDAQNHDPIEDLSNALGLKLARNTLKEALLFWLPEAIRGQFRAAFHAVVVNISKKSQP